VIAGALLQAAQRKAPPVGLRQVHRQGVQPLALAAVGDAGDEGELARSDLGGWVGGWVGGSDDEVRIAW